MGRIKSSINHTKNLLCWAAIVIVGALTLAGAFGGFMRPDNTLFGKALPLAVMVFPIMAPCLLVATLIVALLRSKAWIGGAAAMLLCLFPALNIYPFHPLTGLSRDSKTLSLLTYNCWAMSDFGQPDRPWAEGCRVIDFLLEEDTDVVCLQEADDPIAPPHNRITPEQEKQLKARYPYWSIDRGAHSAILSKYELLPLKVPEVHTSHDQLGRQAFAGALVVAKGDTIALISCHLESLGLSREDKEIYEQIADGKVTRAELREAKHGPINKLNAANILRATQVDSLAAFVGTLKYPVIVCGDFNDVPLSYPLRRLRRAGMKEVYPAVGTGSAVTFHADKFYFRIDHILWKGALQPVKVDVIRNDISDHYAMKAVFDLP